MIQNVTNAYPLSQIITRWILKRDKLPLFLMLSTLISTSSISIPRSVNRPTIFSSEGRCTKAHSLPSHVTQTYHPDEYMRLHPRDNPSAQVDWLEEMEGVELQHNSACIWTLLCQFTRCLGIWKSNPTDWSKCCDKRPGVGDRLRHHTKSNSATTIQALLFT
jgi:hypothetical protein